MILLLQFEQISDSNNPVEAAKFLTYQTFIEKRYDVKKFFLAAAEGVPIVICCMAYENPSKAFLAKDLTYLPGIIEDVIYNRVDGHEIEFLSANSLISPIQDTLDISVSLEGFYIPSIALNSHLTELG